MDLELIAESLNDLSDFGRKLIERCTNRFRLEASNVLEHYVRFSLNIYVCFRTYAHPRADAEFVAKLNCPGSRFGEHSRTTVGISPFNLDSVRGGKESPDDKVMFVPIIKLSEIPEDVFLITIPPVVGLKRFNEFECGLGDSLYFSFKGRHSFFWYESAKHCP